MAKSKGASAKKGAEANGNGESQDRLLDDETMEGLSVLSLDPGGVIPEKSVLVLRQGRMAIRNELKRGQEVLLTVHARCEEIDFKGAERVHLLENVEMYAEEDEDVTEALTEDGVATPDASDGEAEAKSESGSGAKEAVEVAGGKTVEEQADVAALEEAAGDLDWS